MILLAVDYGTKRIGLALLDTDIGVVLPFGVVEAEDEETAARELAKIVKEGRIDRLVFGLSLNLDGGEGENAARARAFSDSLSPQIAPVPVALVDERFSSAQADRMSERASGGEMMASRDERAAMVLLEAYAETLE